MTADAEARAERMREALRELRVADLLDPEPDAAVAADASVGEVVQRMVAGKRLSFVVAAGHEIIGRVHLARIERVPLEQRPLLPVRALAEPLPQIDAGAPLDEAMRRMEQMGAPYIVVSSRGAVVGMLSRDAVMRAVELGELFTETSGRRVSAPWPPAHQPR